MKEIYRTVLLLRFMCTRTLPFNRIYDLKSRKKKQHKKHTPTMAFCTWTFGKYQWPCIQNSEICRNQEEVVNFVCYDRREWKLCVCARERSERARYWPTKESNPKRERKKATTVQCVVTWFVCLANDFIAPAISNHLSILHIRYVRWNIVDDRATQTASEHKFHCGADTVERCAQTKQQQTKQKQNCAKCVLWLLLLVYSIEIGVFSTIRARHYST